MNRPFHGRTRTAAAVVAAVALGVLAGCSSSSSTTSASPPPARPPRAAPPPRRRRVRRPRAPSPHRPAAPSRAWLRPEPRLTWARSTPTSPARASPTSRTWPALLHLRERQRRHQRAPDQVLHQDRADQPSQIASEANQLVSSDHVVGIDGQHLHHRVHDGPGLLEELGFYIIDSGIAPECWSTPNSAAANMGPRYQRRRGAVRARHGSRQKDRLRPVKRAWHHLHRRGAERAGQGRGCADHGHDDQRAGLRRQLGGDLPGNAAGKDGSVVLNFTPPDALVILEAAQKLNIEDQVKSWGCSTPCNTDFLASARAEVGQQAVRQRRAAFRPTGQHQPTTNLYKAILAQYGKAVSGGIGSFSQFGFVERRGSPCRRLTRSPARTR